jgi:hypothetical protein
MSFMQYGHPWSSGYAIPEYVRAEPPGRGTFTTKWLPRGTIPGLIPDFLAKPVGEKLTGRDDVRLGLGAEVYELVPMSGSDFIEPGSARDPSMIFGREIATIIEKKMQTLAPAERSTVLRGLLEAAAPGMNAAVEKRMAKYEKEGMTPKAALRKAIAISFANRMVEETLEAGKTGKPKKGGLFGTPPKEALSGFWGDAWDKMKEIHCKAAQSPATYAFMGGLSTVYTGSPQAGQTGAAIVDQTTCPQPEGGAALPGGAGAQPQTPSWLIPAAIGGGVLLLVLVLK